MAILDETARLVKERLGSEIEALTTKNIVIGLFFTGVKLSNGECGVCFTTIKDIPQAVCCPGSAGRIPDPRKVRGMGVEEALSSLYSPEPIKVAVAIATLNGLSSTCLSRGWKAHYHIRTKTDALDLVPMPEESRVVVVGAIVPALQKLKQRGGEWWVIEQDPRTLKADEMPHFVPAESSREAIDRAEVLIITGTALVNHTLDRILEGTRPGIEITVVGPTASLLPDPLFERGVKLVGGVRVKRPDELLSVLAAGGSGHHFFDHLAERIVIRNE